MESEPHDMTEFSDNQDPAGPGWQVANMVPKRPTC